ncbi:MAG TPA: vitamin K epoxide reductase family protein [Anaerolineales bacterium]|nr:vitamin K epoxide reductase family protein [Anaerolineales bacterium]
MANPIKHPVSRFEQILKWTTIGLAILGMVDAIYLLILKYTQAEVMCVGNHGCITVNNSSYSMIYGIPVSVFGILAYLAIAGIVFMETRSKLLKENGPLAVFGISLAGVAFSAYLTYLEFYVIHAVCPFCMASATIITLILILAIIRLFK